ncbi:MAG: hypothetical protein H0T45_06655 [Pyrinomonadaceae bacterium]|nr:hypothetical protein [Pyrinomonadaceae bacterium]
MSAQKLARLLERLEELKRPAAADGERRERARLEEVLAQLANSKFTDAGTLIRFHEALLFMRAYPRDAKLLRRTEKILASFKRYVDGLSKADADMSAFVQPEAAGVAGTEFSAVFSYDIVRWLARAHASQVALDWDGYEELPRVVATLPRFLPLFAEDAYVDAHVPFCEWLRAACGKDETELDWLLRQFERLPRTEQEQAELFDALKLWLHWQLADSQATRTHMKRPISRVFYHDDGPLLTRRAVNLARELSSALLPVEKFSPAGGAQLLAQGRDAMAVRLRELHGFTYGDERHVLRAEAGRGVEFFVWGVPPARRLPTLAYHAAFILKNGIPHGYAETLTLCERTEIGLNLFYTFREGESAWIYARLMRLYRQLLGVTVFSVEPYQLGGSGNEEGIESGAFWFYRKLGFRPVRPELAALCAREESKIARRHGYRTPANTLRRLASGHVLYEAPGAQSGQWDQFHVRHLGLAVARRTAARFGGDAGRARRHAASFVSRILGVNIASWPAAARHAFTDLALVWSLIPDLARWTNDEKKALARLARAKAGADELQYVRLLHRHRRLRAALIKLGSEAG